MLRELRWKSHYFNPRPCTRSDMPKSIQMPIRVYFNPRPCTRSDDFPATLTAVKSLFQPTPLHEERPHGHELRTRTARFQPTPLHEERPRWCNQFRQCQGISTHAPARGATCEPHGWQPGDPISTHAPARGATFYSANLAEDTHISTHAPARGATRGEVIRYGREAKFQPTPLHEERRTGFVSVTVTQPISTHAPARGATILRRHSGDHGRISTHAPARGATASCRWPPTRLLFQPTPLHEERPSAGIRSARPNQFQPTPLHEERHGVRIS